MEIIVREISVKDANQINRLSEELGYPLTAEQTRRNISAVIESKDHTAFVASYKDEVIGWVGAAHVIMLEVMPHCEINGLVIDKQYRGQGVGKLLIDSVKEWAKGKGNHILSLHCNIKREDAHRFYEHIGFVKIKQQSNFIMKI